MVQTWKPLLPEALMALEGLQAASGEKQPIILSSHEAYKPQWLATAGYPSGATMLLLSCC